MRMAIVTSQFGAFLIQVRLQLDLADWHHWTQIATLKILKVLIKSADEDTVDTASSVHPLLSHAACHMVTVLWSSE